MEAINQYGGDEPVTPADPKKLDQEAAYDRIASEQWGAYTRARDAGHLDYVEQARKFDDYYYGEQWEAAVRQELESVNRPAHTINLVLSTVNAVIGEYIANRQDIAFKPRGKGANQDTANSLRFLFKQIADNNDSEFKEQQVFADGLIQDRGYFYYYLDFSDNMQGEARELVLDPTDVIIDPGAKEYDPNTWAEVFISRWMTPDEVGAIYGPEFAEKLENLQGSGTFGHDSIEWEAPTFAGTYHDSDVFNTSTNPEDAKRVKRVRIVERQYKKLSRTAYFLDKITGDMRQVPEGWDKEKIVDFADSMDLDIFWKPERRIRVTITADHCVLHDGWSLFTRFSVVPFFPYFRRGRPFGLVRNLISPQDMLNKITSQELHVVNTTANSGWIFQTGSLVNMDADDLRAQGAKTGLVLEYSGDPKAKPEKIQPNSVPTGLDKISAKAGIFFREISGVNAAMLGSDNSDSSKALDTRRRGGLIQQEIIFDHLAKTRKLRAQMLLEIVQGYYTETRLIQVFEKNEDGDDIEAAITINEPVAEDEILNDLTLGEYGVVISTVPAASTYEESLFEQLKAMREMGVQIPDHVLIEHSQLPDKRDVSQIVKKIQGLAAPTEEEIQEAQIMKQFELRRLNAEIMEIEAQAIERRANAEKLAAEAGYKMQQPQFERTKLGLDTRVAVDKSQLEYQTNREDLATRLLISKDKNEANVTVEQIDSMTKRTSAALQRQSDLEKALLALRASRERSRTSDNKKPA